MLTLIQENLLTCQSPKFVSKSKWLNFYFSLGSRWGKSNKLDVSASGLLIRDIVIKTCQATRLRSLATKISLKGRLVGGSSLWIFTRIAGNTGQLEAKKPICVLKKEVDTQRIFCIFGLLTDVNQLDKPNWMKNFVKEDRIERSMNAEDLGKKDPKFTGTSVIMSNNMAADDDITVEAMKKKDDDIVLNEIDSDDSPAETESYAHAPLSNFYFFANQEIPAFNFDMVENKF